MKRTFEYLAKLTLIIFFGWTALIFFQKAPNPFDRFFEISAGSYRSFSDGYPSGSAPFRKAVQETLARDGKITMATYPAIFDLWVKDLKGNKGSYTFDNSVTDKAAERERLKQLIDKK